MKFKHSKVKNTGILFELLVRTISAAMTDNKQDNFALGLIREHFHPKSELGKELQLYRTFFNVNKLSEAKALDMLNIILERRKSLNEKLLNSQKFLLIKEIKKNCDLKEFMAGRVPSYKVYASIYKLFEATIRNSDDIETFTQIDEIINAKSVIVEHLRGQLKEEPIIKESNYEKIVKEQPEEIRFLSYKFLLERFNEKYSVFNDKQKNLLREYINNGTNVEKFRSYVKEESEKIVLLLNNNLYKVRNDVTKIKINEVISQLHNIGTKTTIKDNYITALLIAYQISQELDQLR